MESNRIIQVEEKVPFQLLIPLSIQHMFAMFGASVLVPFLFGINPAVVLFMNGLGTLIFIVISFIGSVPTTTYGENIGVMAVTKVYSVQVIAGAAIISMICSFIGKLAALIQTIPGPVIGGISFLLYGMIGTSGLRILVDSRVDYSKNCNQALTAVIFVTGLSGIKLNIGNIQLTGMVLACVTGMILSLVFYAFDKMGLTEKEE